MPQPLLAVTPARLAAFTCPRRYRFTYLADPTPPRGAPWARSTIGAVAHLALHRWWLLPRAHRAPDAGAQLVERFWQPHGFRDDAQSLRAGALVGDWVRAYLAAGRRVGVDPGHDPVGVERTVAARTATLTVSGRVDRIDERDDGQVVVVDYKTGRHRPTPEDAGASTALALYVLGARRTLRRPVRRVELHHLPTGTVAAFEHTEDTLAGHVDRAEHAARRIAAATAQADADRAFPPEPGPWCSCCDFRRVCPEGQAASEPRASWDGLPDELG